jgi:hypothetical protein
MSESKPIILTDWELQYLLSTAEMQPSYLPFELPTPEGRAKRILLMSKLRLEMEIIKRRKGE